MPRHSLDNLDSSTARAQQPPNTFDLLRRPAASVKDRPLPPSPTPPHYHHHTHLTHHTHHRHYTTDTTTITTSTTATATTTASITAGVATAPNRTGIGFFEST